MPHFILKIQNLTVDSYKWIGSLKSPRFSPASRTLLDVRTVEEKKRKEEKGKQPRCLHP